MTLINNNPTSKDTSKNHCKLIPKRIIWPNQQLTQVNVSMKVYKDLLTKEVSVWFDTDQFLANMCAWQ